MDYETIDPTLRGPLLTLSMEHLVQGHPKYAHNIQEWIYEAAKDQNVQMAEYVVLNIESKFTVFYREFND